MTKTIRMNVRPASYYVQLLADDVKVGDKIILESASDFSKTWTGLQKNRTGKVGEAIRLHSRGYRTSGIL